MERARDRFKSYDKYLSYLLLIVAIGQVYYADSKFSAVIAGAFLAVTILMVVDRLIGEGVKS